MNKIVNKNLIATFVMLALVLSFSFAKPVSARTVRVPFGATNSYTDTADVNHNTYDYNTYNYNTYDYNSLNNNTNNNKLVPVITSISSSSAVVGTEGKAITINGYNFIPSSVARWDNSDRNTDYINSRQLIIYTTDEDMKELGDHSITVFNQTANSGISNERIFTLEKEAKNSSLGANALFAGFMPSLLQWLLLLLLILLIVIFVRKVLRKKRITLTASDITSTSVILNANGLLPDEIYMLQIAGHIEPIKVQINAGKDRKTGTSFHNLIPGTHYTASISKYDPSTKNITNLDAPVIYFDTLKYA